jgi:hypothetical protein
VKAFPAQVLRLICGVWVRALKAGMFGPSQVKIAEKAQQLLEALAEVAIISLIDEATGLTPMSYAGVARRTTRRAVRRRCCSGCSGRICAGLLPRW